MAGKTRVTKMYLGPSGEFLPEIDTIDNIVNWSATTAVAGGTGISMLTNTSKHALTRSLTVYNSDGATLNYVIYDGTIAAGTPIWQRRIANTTATVINTSWSGMIDAATVVLDTLDTAFAAAGLTTHVANATFLQWAQQYSGGSKAYINTQIDTEGAHGFEPHPHECRVSGVNTAHVTAGTGFSPTNLSIATGEKIQLDRIEIYHTEGSDATFMIYDGTVAAGTKIWSQAIPTATQTDIDLSYLPLCVDTGNITVDVDTTTANAALPVISIGGLKWLEQHV